MNLDPTDTRQYYYMDGFGQKRLLKKATIQRTVFLDEENREVGLPLCEIRYEEKIGGNGLVVEKRL